jgi:hypothetical protein
LILKSGNSMKIELVDLGILEYKKVYLEVDIPRLFICSFSKDDRLWLGIHVDEISDLTKWSAGEGRINDYYLTEITEDKQYDLEAGTIKLHTIFDQPVLWLSHRYTDTKQATLCKSRTRISPMYEIPEDATLNI